MTDIAQLRRLTLRQRDALADLLSGLHDDDWARPTLCQGWSVRDVVAHLVAWDALLLRHDKLGYPATLARWTAAMVRNRFDQARFNGRAVGQGPDDPALLLQRFKAQADQRSRWLWERVAPGAQLAEYLIHHEDIARPLQRHGDHDKAVLLAALDGVARLPGLGARDRLKRHRWVADDLGWSRGSGPERHAPALDILLALAGRPAPWTADG